MREKLLVACSIHINFEMLKVDNYLSWNDYVITYCIQLLKKHFIEFQSWYYMFLLQNVCVEFSIQIFLFHSREISTD